MIAKLREIERDTPPTDVPPPARERRHAHWVEPRLVAEVRFTSWTRDGVLRHPVFVGLRTDKPGAEIVREKAMDVKKIKEQTNGASSNGHDKKTPTPALPRRPAVSSTRGGGKNEEEVAGLRLTHPDKVLFADRGVTKRDLAQYYALVAEWMLPHVVDRPLALVRCPDGMAGKCFFQRNWSETLAGGDRESGSGGGEEERAACDGARFERVDFAGANQRTGDSYVELQDG